VKFEKISYSKLSKVNFEALFYYKDRRTKLLVGIFIGKKQNTFYLPLFDVLPLLAIVSV